jgi:flagellar basal body-associated protein FliL
MINQRKIWIWIIVIVVILLGVWWYMSSSSSSTPDQTTPTGQAQSYNTQTPSSAALTDDSGPALAQDADNIDTQMTGLNSDNTNADQALSNQ